MDALVECMATAEVEAEVLGLLRVALALVSCYDTRQQHRRATGDGEGGGGDDASDGDGGSDDDDDDDDDDGDGANDGHDDAQRRDIGPGADHRRSLRDWHDVVVRIADQTHVFFGADLPTVSFHAFAVFTRCCELLRLRRRLLHPLLHRAWPAVAPRLQPGAPPVCRLCAVRLVYRLFTDLSCAQFLCTRFRETVWPAFVDVLRDGAWWLPRRHVRRSDLLVATRADASSDAGLRARSSAHGSVDGDGGPSSAAMDRCSSEVLRCIEAVATSSDGPAVLRPVAWQLCASTAPFILSSSPPPLLRLAAATLTAVATRVDGDAVWLYLHRLLPRVVLTPPCDAVRAVVVGGDASLAWCGLHGVSLADVHAHTVAGILAAVS